jgi:hypothetical protein
MEINMTDPKPFIAELEITLPVIGVYDAPDPALFKPLVLPSLKGNPCVFAFFKQWKSGKTLCLEAQRSGCFGCSYWMLGREHYSRRSFVNFLVVCEGLKATVPLMEEWLDHTPPYHPDNQWILIGPLKETHYEYLKTVTFFVTPDQLAALVLAANTHCASSGPVPVIAPFGPGCGQLLALFKDLSVPQAIIGATDIAMRKNIPPDILAFTVTKPLFEHVCSLGNESFLNKPFWKQLKSSRKK